MCGIFGILAHTPPAPFERSRFDLTASLLAHRGPDNQAVVANDCVGFVHTRLALVDLDPRSNQPFWGHDGRFCLLFNGEIYNFREIRAELEARGVAFRTSGDTEVLLESLVHCGLDATLGRLEGMFAFALYDAHQQTLVLARDRFGIKPLYVHDGDEAFVFASEIRALRPWVRFEPDLLSISGFLQGLGGPMSGASLLRGIRIVPPATTIVVRPGERGRYRCYWTPPQQLDPDELHRLRRSQPRRLVDDLERTLFAAVRMQLLADAPVGVLCSGGVDSSLVTAMASRIHSNLAIFHANVAGPDSELEAAADVARHLKVDLLRVDVCDEDSIDQMPNVMLHYGQPFIYHPNSVPFLMVAELARRSGVKAVLSGEGADEMFVGYPWLIFNLRESMLGASISVRHAYRLLRRILRPTPAGAASPVLDSRDLVRALHNRFEGDLDEEELSADIEQRTGKTPSGEVRGSFRALGYHLRSLLHRNDCLGMAASIEARFPFLDGAVVRLALNLPHRTKVRFSPAARDREHLFLHDKWILRKVAERYLPRRLAWRRKLGFPTRAAERLRIAPEFFFPSFVEDRFALSRREFEFLWRHADQALRMRLLHLEVWARVCLEAVPPARVRDELRQHVFIE